MEHDDAADNDGPEPEVELSAQSFRAITIGHDAVGNVLVTGDHNHVNVTIIAQDRRLVIAQLSDVSKPIINPFPGLAAFDERESDYFFGRTKLVKRAWTLFQSLQNRSAPRILFVVGSSGSGKTSLVRAGLIPALVLEPVDGLEGCFFLIMRPGHDPLARLAEIVGRLPNPPPSHDTIDSFRRGPYALHLLINSQLGNDRRRVVLVIDQFEELFTQCSDGAARDLFLDLVEYAVSQPDRRNSVIATLRSDFTGSVKSPPAFAVAVRESRLTVQAMDRHELRDAIALPAKLLGVEWPTELVDNLVSQAEGRAGALPLLQFALKRLWPANLAGRLQDADWSSKLIEDFLVQAADALFAVATPVQQRIIRRAFVGMVQLGEGTEDTRRVARLSSLVAMSETAEQVGIALEPFAAPEARLVSISLQDGETSFELTHESLITAWDRFQEWLGNTADKDRGARIRASLRQMRRLSAATFDWVAAAESSTSLWSPAAITRYDESIDPENADLTEKEGAFLLASRKANERSARRAGALRAAIAAVALLMTMISAFAGWQWWLAEGRQEEVSRELNDSQLLTGFVALQNKDWGTARHAFYTVSHSPVVQPSQQFASLLGASEALRRSRTSLTEAATGLGRIEGLAYSPDGKQMLAIGRSGNLPTLKVLDARSLAIVKSVVGDEPSANNQQGSSFTSVAWSQQGLIMVGSADGRVYFLDGTTFERKKTVAAHANLVSDVVFSPDGTKAVSLGLDEKLLLWDISKLSVDHAIVDGSNASLDSPAFSPDGTSVVYADGSAKAFIFKDLSTGVENKRSFGLDDVNSIAVYEPPKGCCDPFVAAISNYAIVEISGGDASQTVKIGESAPWWGAGDRIPLLVSTDGKTLAFTDRDNNILVVDSLSGKELHRLGAIGTVHVNRLAMSANGDIAEGDETGEIRLWNLGDDFGVAILPGSERSFITGVAADQNGATLATSGYDGDLSTWDVDTAKQLTSYHAYEPLGGVTFGEDREHAFAQGWNGRLMILETRSGTAVGEINTKMFGWFGMGTGGTRDRFVTGGGGEIDVRRRDTGESLAHLTGTQGAQSAVVLSATGKTVVAGMEGGGLLRWDVDHPASPVKLRPGNGDINSINYLGQTLEFAVCDAGGTISIYPENATVPRLSFKAHVDSVGACQSDPSGTWVVSGADDGKLKLWGAARQLYEFDFGFRGTVHGVLVLPDGRGLAAAVGGNLLLVNFRKVQSYLDRVEAHSARKASVE